jgi:hypothetical protein
MFGWLVEALVVKAVAILSDIPSAKDRLQDPVYKKNIEKLIERNRMFEDAKE